MNVGHAGFSAGATDCESLAFNPSNGDPYVAYEDGANSYKATVMDYAAPAGIIELKSSQISIYPNPATDKITIETSATQGQSQLSVMNLNGEEVLTRSLIKPKTQIDISNLPIGIYFVRLSNDKTVEVGKFVKQ